MERAALEWESKMQSVRDRGNQWTSAPLIKLCGMQRILVKHNSSTLTISLYQEDDSLVTRRSGSDQATLGGFEEQTDSRGQVTLATFVALNFLWLTGRRSKNKAPNGRSYLTRRCEHQRWGWLMAVQIDWFTKPLSSWFYSSHACSHNSTSFGFVWSHPYIPPPSHPTAEFGDAKPIGGTPHFAHVPQPWFYLNLVPWSSPFLRQLRPLSRLNQEAAKSFFAIL